MIIDKEEQTDGKMMRKGWKSLCNNNNNNINNTSLSLRTEDVNQVLEQ